MKRIMSARELSRCLVERFRRDGVFSGPRWLDKGELILPMRPEFRRLFENALQLRQSCDRAATSSRDFADAVASMYEDAILYGSPIDSAADMIVGLIPKQHGPRATFVPVDFATFANPLNRSDDDWHELSEIAVNAERKANRARERALKRSRRNAKNPKKKGKCR
jgi:hypothetical protein|nr:MAG TPA_asm: hypothetical protein [Caudoviricetes sp.]